MLKYQAASRQCLRALVRRPQTRHSSGIDFSKLEATLKERELPVIHDTLSPTPSYLLNQSLKDFLDSERYAQVLTPAPGYRHLRLPPGHHLVYFSTPTTASQLLPDGTDTLHSPGPPFTQRLWAGGRVQFVDPDQLRLDGRAAALVERIQDVRVIGEEGLEKIFVGIERRIVKWIGGVSAATMRRIMLESPEEEMIKHSAGLIEWRDLCFLRSDVSPLSSFDTPRKALKPPPNPSFIFPLTPTPALLFRFSALTFNAHAIHIDPEYTRNVYGLPKLLVHGPLCLILMLESLNRTIRGTERTWITEITYRNFRPVFVGEELRVCGKMKISDRRQGRSSEIQDWEIWIEIGDGENAALAVRGTASVTAGRPRTPK
jgi:hydroxyacyl-ACP dehydratase HTD2-like protein with hotdog domain